MKVIDKQLKQEGLTLKGAAVLSKKFAIADKDDPKEPNSFNAWLKRRRMHWVAYHDPDVMDREKKKW